MAGRSPEGLPRRGLIGYMVESPVAANLLMVVLLVGGALSLTHFREEVFPSLDPRVVRVSVAYPGASPEEVERALAIAVEDALRGIEGIRRIRSTSTEGGAEIAIELTNDADRQKAHADVTAAVNGIQTFPPDVEAPRVSLDSYRESVLSLLVHGDVALQVLQAHAERLRDRLAEAPAVGRVTIDGAPRREISIEVAPEVLRAYGLTLEQVARAVRQGSVELPAGSLKTAGGELLLRTDERRLTGADFGDLTLISTRAGGAVRLGDIAHIEDGFEESDDRIRYEGRPALRLRVFADPRHSPVDTSRAARALASAQAFPPGVHVATWYDDSEAYADRIALLARNGVQGLLLVLCCLGLFLEPRLAFWVTLGIPTALFGAFLLMDLLDISLNMISAFALIMTLGIVVDDAIVVGEAIHRERSAGREGVRAALEGVRGVARPVIFSVLTTLVAFAPLFFIPGVWGQILFVIPTVVTSVLLLSLLEALLVLPQHLAHARTRAALPSLNYIDALQRRVDAALDRWVQRGFAPWLARVSARPWWVLGVAVSLLLWTAGVLAGEHIPRSFMPRIDADFVSASLRLPVGTPREVTEAHERRLIDAAEAAVNALSSGAGADVREPQQPAGHRGILSTIGPDGGHICDVHVYLPSLAGRHYSAQRMARAWQARVGKLPLAESLEFEFETGQGAGPDLSVALSHADASVLRSAARQLASRLAGFDAVSATDDGIRLGKQQLDVRPTPAGRALGVTAAELARQLRDAFFGAEALRQIRGTSEERVSVRLSRSERTSLAGLESLIVRAPEGGEIPFREAATVSWGRADHHIRREDGRRVTIVTARMQQEGQAAQVMSRLRSDVLPELMQQYPGLSWSKAGEQQEQEELYGALRLGVPVALLVMFALMAVPLGSYLQPLVIMTAIPFGVVGAIAGHGLLGYSLSLMSALGMVAMAGVVVNASLVLLDAVNTLREQGVEARRAVIEGTCSRLRAVLLTSLTTFLGLLPLILETSFQARFLVPMAISLAFGVLLSSLVVLVLVPTLLLLGGSHQG